MGGRGRVRAVAGVLLRCEHGCETPSWRVAVAARVWSNVNIHAYQRNPAPLDAETPEVQAQFVSARHPPPELRAHYNTHAGAAATCAL